MKQLTWKLVLPLTIISFASITKWWYVLPIDAPDTMMYGFPLAFMADGWHTSMSYQFFISEFILDLSLYFLFWLITVFGINSFLIKISLPKLLTGILSTISGFLLALSIYVATMPEHVYQLTRNFEYELMTSGTKYIWKWQPRPDFTKYRKGEEN